jgi:hypothetical protein
MIGASDHQVASSSLIMSSVQLRSNCCERSQSTMQDLCTLPAMRAYNVIFSTAAVLVLAKIIQHLNKKTSVDDACAYVRFAAWPMLHSSDWVSLLSKECHYPYGYYILRCWKHREEALKTRSASRESTGVCLHGTQKNIPGPCCRLQSFAYCQLTSSSSFWSTQMFLVHFACFHPTGYVPQTFDMSLHPNEKINQSDFGRGTLVPSLLHNNDACKLDSQGKPKCERETA